MLTDGLNSFFYFIHVFARQVTHVYKTH